jgi:probable rRNA maturation factor
VNVFFGDEQDEPVDGAGLRRLAELVLEEEGLPPDTEISLILVGSDQMAEYHRRFMDGQGPTDVLAFPLEDLHPGTVPVRMANAPPVSLGDVFLCPPEVRRHSEEDGLPFEEYLALLVVHGILHLLGYDHHDDPSAEQMEQRERQLLARAEREHR